MRLLVIDYDNDTDFVRTLSMALAQRGFDRQCVVEGGRDTAAPSGRFDVVILGLERPAEFNLGLLGVLRVLYSAPVILAVGVARGFNKARALVLGADDCVAHPVDADELAARIEAVSRGHRAVLPIEFGDVKLDVIRRLVSRGGVDVPASPQEFEVLRALVSARGAVVSRQQLAGVLWGDPRRASTNGLDVMVSRLRRKLQRLGPSFILNERGEGYRVVAPGKLGMASE